ncbi:siphovirus Gp157 family protein [Mesorhizobium retamae]|uniref:Siphovirus Gp157 family protein n=1 Tax=Mesorhizobium retamae TaxID=2912854 RepID=A0ABS9QI25_9HYPH|nr:siphovirus Gp157 family protein [Mesorhizobium sp. IRAMC:0171]MCG7507083.1 siphovirus Gp157 family protein [Mesorhizobium sp. IRAMC:0171]
MTNNFIQANVATLEAHIHALTMQFPELAEDEDLRRDMLEGETDMDSVLTRLLSMQRHSASMAKARADRIKDLQSLKAKDERRDEIARAMLYRVLKAAGLPKAQLVEGTVSIAKGRDSVEVTDVMKLPKWAYVTERKPDKKAIMERLAANESVKGAALKTGQETILIRAA